MADLSLPDAVKKFAGDLAKKLSTFMGDIATLEVKTYTMPTDQPQTVVQGAQDMRGVLLQGKGTLRAYSSISFDGDTASWVPVNPGGEVDKGVWEVHAAVVKQAMENRSATLTAMTAAARNALRALQGVSGQ